MTRFIFSMGDYLSRLWAWYENWWAPVPLTEKVAQERAATLLRIWQADKVIQDHEFDRHMALSALDALDSWSNRHRLPQERK